MQALIYDIAGLFGIGMLSVGAGLNWGLGTGLMVGGGLVVVITAVAARAGRG